MRLAFVMLATCALASVCATGAAQTSRPIVVAIQSGSSEVDELRRDLEGLGAEVVVTALDDGATPQRLHELADDAGAEIAVRVGASSTELWLATDVGWALNATYSLGPEARLRIVESIRGRSRLGVAPVAIAEAPVPPATTPVDERRLSVGAGALVAPSVGISVAIDLAFAYRFDRWLGIAMSLIAAPSGAELQADEGAVTIRPFMASVALRIPFTDPVTSLSASIDAGLFAGVVVAQGHATSSSFAGSTAIGATLGPLVRANLAIPITPALSIAAHVTVGATLLPVVIGIAGRDVTRWGEPWTSAGLALEGVIP